MIREKQREEFSRAVSCTLCRDYHVLAIYPRKHVKQKLVLCSCEGARKSEYFGKVPSVLIELEGGRVKCVKCGEQVYEFDESKLNTYFDGGDYLLICCKKCKAKIADESEKFDEEMLVLEKDTQPKISREELMKRFKERQGKKDGQKT
jgi:hypothetical protein